MINGINDLRKKLNDCCTHLEENYNNYDEEEIKDMYISLLTLIRVFAIHDRKNKLS